MEDEQYLGLCIIGISGAILFYSFTILSRPSEASLIFGFQLLGASVIFIIAGALLIVRGLKYRKIKK
ncbi:MAG: hypothetical protein ACFFA3_19195 [Promethearchaeota archaeon]